MIVGRRTALALLGATATPLIFGAKPLLAQVSDDFSVLLAELDNSASQAITGEQDFRRVGPTPAQVLGNPQLPRRWTSDKRISEGAFKLIVVCEVSNEETYTKKYQSPIWPGERSGVTAGIGYDLGYQQVNDIIDDWSPCVDQRILSKLLLVQGKKSLAARDALPAVSDVVIDWNAAQINFKNTLKFYCGETIRFFPNSAELNEDCFGSLVSIVFNRGSASNKSDSDPLDRRKEIREIKALCLRHSFVGIPAQIRNMKRLWTNNVRTKGLLVRREAEAVLFERGLAHK